MDPYFVQAVQAVAVGQVAVGPVSEAAVYSSSEAALDWDSLVGQAGHRHGSGRARLQMDHIRMDLFHPTQNIHA